MNKLSKIFLIIIIILVIALGIMTYFCIENRNRMFRSNETLWLIVKAVNDAGFDIENKEDGSSVLVKKVDTE